MTPPAMTVYCFSTLMIVVFVVKSEFLRAYLARLDKSQEFSRD